MENALRYIGEKLIKKKKNITEDFAKKQTPEPHQTNGEEWFQEIARLVEYLGESLFTDDESSMQQTGDWGGNLGCRAVKEGVPLDRALQGLRIFHSVIWESIEKEVASANLPAENVFSIAGKLDPLLDHVVYTFSLAYVEDHKRLLELARQSVNELSVPIVPIYDEVAVLPVIGEIDTERAKYIMETALSRSTELELSYLIFDLSGVLIIDTMVAHNLYQVVKALELIGVQTILTGIRPEIAQTVTSLGIDFSDVRTCATMKQALVELGFERKKK